MRKIFKSTLAFAAGAAMLAGVAMTPSTSLAWGDNSNGGRRSYTIDQINHGALGDKIVFNSISNSVIGDEKNFVAARLNTGINAGVNNVWNANEITAENGKEYLVRLYVHNNNPGGTSAVSHNTRVAFDVPEISSKKIQVNGFIYSDNASPSEYWDYVNFVSDQNFHLEYVDGSASVENNGYASQINGGAKALSDNIVKKAASEHGVQIGYEKQDGEIPGCYTYANYVSIRVKVVYDEDNHAGDYTIEEKVRLDTSTVWSKTVEAQPGDIVEFQALYKNISNYDQANVMVKTILPRSLEYIPGSTRVYNKVNPSGITIKEDYINTNKAINIGNYRAGANAYIRFKARVKGDYLQYGSNTLVDWTQAGVYPTTIQDFAAVVIHKTEAPQAAEYQLKINYVYADTGKTAAESYIGSFAAGDSYKVVSPVIDDYTVDHAEISGTMGNQDLEYTVKYTKIPDNQPDINWPDPIPDNPDPVVPDDPADEPAVKDLPKTGPVAGSVLGLGALTTAAGYYVASRRALRK